MYSCRKLFLLLPFSLVCFFSGCKKEKQPEQKTTELKSCSHTSLSNDIQKINYKPGTYWILYDSIVKSRDSLIVTQNSGITITSYPQMKGYECSNTAEMLLHSVGQFVIDSLGAITKIADNNSYVTILVSEENQTYIHGYANSYHGVTGVPIYGDYDSPVGANFIKIDSVFIYNKFYKRVIRTNTNTSYYFNSTDGFLKILKKDSTGKVYSNKVLIRHRIER